MSRQTKPGNLERGWNDPPMFIYGSAPTGASVNQVPPKRYILTRRVAFPQDPINNQSASGAFANGNVMASTNIPSAPPLQLPPCSTLPTTIMTSLIPAETSAFQRVQLLPPSISSEPPKFHGPVIVPTMPLNPNMTSSSSSPLPSPHQMFATDPMSNLPVAAVMDVSELQTPSFADDEQMYHYTVTRLQRSLNDCTATAEKRTIDDMQKKLNIFSDMWKNGKVSYPVKSTMARLATAIHRRKHKEAHELHLALMIDHVSEVSKWLVGVKRLIHEVEKSGVNQPISPSVSCCFGDGNEAGNGSTKVTNNNTDSSTATSSNNAPSTTPTACSNSTHSSSTTTMPSLNTHSTCTITHTEHASIDTENTANTSPISGNDVQENSLHDLTLKCSSNVICDGKVTTFSNDVCDISQLSTENDVNGCSNNDVKIINGDCVSGSMTFGSRNVGVAVGDGVKSVVQQQQQTNQQVTNVENLGRLNLGGLQQVEQLEQSEQNSDLQRQLFNLQRDFSLKQPQKQHHQLTQHSNVQQWLDQHLVLNNNELVQQQQHVDQQQQHVDQQQQHVEPEPQQQLINVSEGRINTQESQLSQQPVYPQQKLETDANICHKPSHQQQPQQHQYENNISTIATTIATTTTPTTMLKNQNIVTDSINRATDDITIVPPPSSSSSSSMPS